MGERRVEGIDHLDQPVDRAVVGGARGNAELGAHRRHHRQLVLHRVEHGDDPRPYQDRVRNADRLGLGGRQLLHQPHHVVGEVAEDAGRHRRQPGRHDDAALRNQRPQRLQRVAFAG